MTRTKKQKQKDDFVSPDDPKYVEKALAKLRERGVASELAVAYECRRQGWNVSMSGWYFDPNLGKNRQIDVVASSGEIRPLKHPNRPKGEVEFPSYELELVVEVKSGSDGWVVIQGSPNELPQMPGWEADHDYFKSDSRVPQDFGDGESETILAKQSWVGARICELFSPKDDSAFDGMQQCASAVRYLHAKETVNPQEEAARTLRWRASPSLPVYKAWHPVLVHSGPLFRAGLTTPGMTLDPIPWAPVVSRWQPVRKERRAACLVDVVTAKALPEYLKLMRDRATVIGKSFDAAMATYRKATGAVPAVAADGDY